MAKREYNKEADDLTDEELDALVLSAGQEKEKEKVEEAQPVTKKEVIFHVKNNPSPAITEVKSGPLGNSFMRSRSIWD